MQQKSRSRGSAPGEAKIEPVVPTKADEMSRIGAAADSGFAPAISIVVPFYNRSSFLPLVVKTLEQQTFKDFELIAVDDDLTGLMLLEAVDAADERRLARA